MNQDLGRLEIDHDSNGNVDVQLLMTSDNIWMTQKQCRVVWNCGWHSKLSY